MLVSNGIVGYGNVDQVTTDVAPADSVASVASGSKNRKRSNVVEPVDKPKPSSKQV